MLFCLYSSVLLTADVDKYKKSKLLGSFKGFGVSVLFWLVWLFCVVLATGICSVDQAGTHRNGSASVSLVLELKVCAAATAAVATTTTTTTTRLSDVFLQTEDTS